MALNMGFIEQEFSGEDYFSTRPVMAFRRSDCVAVHPKWGDLYEVEVDGQRRYAAIRIFKGEEIKIRRPHLPDAPIRIDAGPDNSDT